MTEDEAKTKACCRTLCADIWSNPKENDGECKTATTPCIGSACMAWRWGQKRNPDWSPDQSGMMSWPARHPEDKPKLYIKDDKHGYCGLAGKP